MALPVTADSLPAILLGHRISGHTETFPEWHD
jgi:hypothetical protein